MLQLFSYSPHLMQSLAYHTCRDAFIQRASVTTVILRDLYGVVLLSSEAKQIG